MIFNDVFAKSEAEEDDYTCFTGMRAPEMHAPGVRASGMCTPGMHAPLLFAPQMLA